MANCRKFTLKQRRLELLERSQLQRRILGEQREKILNFSFVPEIGSYLSQKARKHRIGLSGVLIGLLVLRPRRVFALFQVGVVARKMVRVFSPEIKVLWHRFFDKVVTQKVPIKPL